MDTYDLGPSCRTLRDLVVGTTDDQLDQRTPCPDYTVADLCDHIGGLTIAFTFAARKTSLPGEGNPSGDGSRLEPGWRERIAADLDALAVAWADPAAYEGMTQAGPIELPAPVAAQVALNEVVVHAWDLAVSTGRSYEPDPTALGLCTDFVSTFDAPVGDGPFGPPLPAPDDADDLDRLIALTGRDPRTPVRQ